MEQIGKYEVVRLLATGGMAEVYLAKTGGVLGFEKTVVVKKIRSHLLGDPQFLEMFLNEAKIAAQLNHPNIVQVFDFGEAEDDVYFLAMEYIDGPNLRALSATAQKSGKPLSLPLCAKILSYTCEGLAYAHELVNPETQRPLNIVHRDLSPDNVVIAKNGAVKLVDFGIAKAAEQLYQTQSGLRKGKLAYMSPEYIKGEQPDRRSDVYALGVVLYELISGKKPYDVENELALMHAMLYEPFVPLRVRRPDVPADLERIVNKVLARDPGERYQSCSEMQADLEQFVIDHGEPLSAFHISRVIAGLQPELDAAALAKTPSRAKSPPVAGTARPSQKTPPTKSTGASGEKRGPVEARRSPSGEKRGPSGEKRPSGERREGTLPRPLQVLSVPPEEGEERTLQTSKAEVAAKAAALEQGLDSLRKDFSDKAAAYGEGASSAPTLTMPAVKEPVRSTPTRSPPPKPHSERAKTEPAMARVEPEPASKTAPPRNMHSKATTPGGSPPVDLLTVVRQHALAFGAVAVALLLLGGGLGLVLSPAHAPAKQEVAMVKEVQPAPAAQPPPPHPPEPVAVAQPKPPDPAPQPQKVVGTLEVTSNVSGTVKIGKLEKKISSGRTVRFDLKPNKYDVELINPETGYWMKQVKQVEIKKEETVPVGLEVAKGQAVVSSPMTGDADVYFDTDAQPRGKAPARFELDEGKHVVRVVSNKKPQPYTEEIVIQPGQEKRVVAKYQ